MGTILRDAQVQVYSPVIPWSLLDIRTPNHAVFCFSAVLLFSLKMKLDYGGLIWYSHSGQMPWWCKDQDPRKYCSTDLLHISSLSKWFTEMHMAGLTTRKNRQWLILKSEHTVFLLCVILFYRGMYACVHMLHHLQEIDWKVQTW